MEVAMKKLIVALIAIAIIVPLCLVLAFNSAETITETVTVRLIKPAYSGIGDVYAGDVNGDGKVSVLDSVTLMMYLAGKPVEIVNDAADSNGDGIINIKDISDCIRNTVNNIKKAANPDQCEHALVQITEAVPATCTVNGMAEGWQCTKCQKIFKDQSAKIAVTQSGLVIKAAHKMEMILVLSAQGCTHGEEHLYRCSVCRFEEERKISDPLGHVEGEWTVAIEPTETKDGARRQLCTVCGAVLNNEIILRTGAAEHEHSIVIDPAVESTCIPGKTEGQHCEVCLEILIPQEELPATDHAQKIEYNTVPSTCTTNGYRTMVCVKCTEVWFEILPLADHTFEEWITVPATKTEDGSVSCTCSGCSLTQSYRIPYTGSEGLAFTLNSDSKSYSVTGIGTCTDTEVVIPAFYEGKPVTSIEYGAFYNCTSLTSIKLPISVASIGSDAFKGCIGLTNIKIPNSVFNIGMGAFAACSNVENITVESGNNVYHSDSNCLIETATKTLIAGCKNSIIPTDGSVNHIGRSAFSGCTGLVSIEIPNGVKSIREWAFSGCTGLVSIEIPNGVKSIGECAFDGCRSLTSINIPKSVTRIEERAFSDCTNLENVTVEAENTVYHSTGNCLIETATKTLVTGCKSSIIPADGSVVSIGHYAFLGCTGMASIEIPNGVQSIGEWAFDGCTGLTSIEIPNSVTSIGRFAFFNCTSLVNIEIPKSVTIIGSHTFCNCIALVSVEIPNSVTSIGG